MPTDILSWDYLSTFAGMAFVCYWLVQFTKGPVDKLLGRWGYHLETSHLAWFWGTVLTIMVWGYQGTLTGWNLALAPLNAIFVGLGAMRTHEAGAGDGYDDGVADGYSDGYSAALEEPIDSDLTPEDIAAASTPVAKAAKKAKSAGSTPA